MFTGLVQDVATVSAVSPSDGGVLLTVKPKTLDCNDLEIGESISHAGACLTVTEIGDDWFATLAGQETLRVTTFGSIEPGHHVNLERALRVGDRLGGHYVTGHVDCVGELLSREDHGDNLVLAFSVPREFRKYTLNKGSITIDGVSLTINELLDEGVSVALIPHTREVTTLGALQVGGKVNLEVDTMAKYVERLLPPSV